MRGAMKAGPKKPLDTVTQLCCNDCMNNTQNTPTTTSNGTVRYISVAGNAARGYTAAVQHRNGRVIVATDCYPFAGAALAAGHKAASTL